MEQQQDEQPSQPQSNFKQWLQKRKDSRREKKQHRKRSKSTTENDSHCDGGDMDGNDGGIETNSGVTTVMVRLILSDREYDDATTFDENDSVSHHNVLAAIVSRSIFSQKDGELIGTTNDDAMEEGADAAGDNIDDAGDCNHPCHKGDDMVQQQAPLLHENKADSAAQVADEDKDCVVEKSNFRVKESYDDVELDASNSASLLRNSPSSKGEEVIHRQEGVLTHSNEGKTPICKTTEHCPSTQGSASVHSQLPMTQQLPDFDYYTQASIESPVIDRDEKTLHKHDMSSCVSYIGSSKKDSIPKKQTMLTIDNTTEPLGKENLSLHSQNENSNNDDMTRQPLQHKTTPQHNVEHVKNTNVYRFQEYDEPYNQPFALAGVGFTSVGSGKAIAVNEEELVKAAKLLVDDTQTSA
eukprot:scaffold20091_cov174-Skeletonema_menzelii.AAC.1